MRTISNQEFLWVHRGEKESNSLFVVPQVEEGELLKIPAYSDWSFNVRSVISFWIAVIDHWHTMKVPEIDL